MKNIGAIIFGIGATLLVGYWAYEAIIFVLLENDLPLIIRIGIAGILIGIVVVLFGLIVERITDKKTEKIYDVNNNRNSTGKGN